MRELDSATSLNLVLTDLKEEDTTQTLYAAAYAKSTETGVNPAAAKSKVDTVCDAVRESLDKINPNK